MVSNFRNQIEEFQSNDIILPIYDPKLGKTDFADDKHLQWFYNYINFIESLTVQVPDVRKQMQAMPYELYLKRSNKSMRYESTKDQLGTADNPVFWFLN